MLWRLCIYTRGSLTCCIVSSSNVNAQIEAEDMNMMQQIRPEDWVCLKPFSSIYSYIIFFLFCIYSRYLCHLVFVPLSYWLCYMWTFVMESNIEFFTPFWWYRLLFCFWIFPSGCCVGWAWSGYWFWANGWSYRRCWYNSM